MSQGAWTSHRHNACWVSNVYIEKKEKKRGETLHESVTKIKTCGGRTRDPPKSRCDLLDELHFLSCIRTYAFLLKLWPLGAGSFRASGVSNRDAVGSN